MADEGNPRYGNAARLMSEPLSVLTAFAIVCRFGRGALLFNGMLRMIKITEGLE